MDWVKDVDLAKYKVAGAPFGGPVALVRDENKIVAVQKQSVKPLISVYSSSGRKIVEIQVGVYFFYIFLFLKEKKK